MCEEVLGKKDQGEGVDEGDNLEVNRLQKIQEISNK